MELGLLPRDSSILENFPAIDNNSVFVISQIVEWVRAVEGGGQFGLNKEN